MLWKDSAAVKPYIAVREPDGYHGKIHETSWSVWPTWESWNWQGWEGKPVEVEVYTKASQVALYCNDRLVGKEAVGAETGYKAVFTVDYEPGVLKAVTAEGSAVLATAGQPAAIRLTPDRRILTADGQDLALVTVEVVDAEGRVCPDAAIACEGSVEGQGRLLAFASADLKDREPTTSARVTTWKGRALLVVRSSSKRGRIAVSVKSSLPTARLSLSSRL
jgi:beta-galactosidase